MEKEKEYHFILVHGACHGAWCWYKVATLLKLAGHKVTALDLAASGVNSKRVDEIESVSEHFQPLMEFMSSLSLEEKVIIVGHSLGGVSVSVAMEKFPEKISVAVFVAASMPGPAFTVPTLKQEFFRRLGENSLMDTQYIFNKGPQEPPTSFIFGPQCLSYMMYQLCPVEDLTLAKMLMRPESMFDDAKMIEETKLSEEKYGSVSRVYIVAGEDKVMEEDFQRWIIKNNPVLEVKVIPDSDHMVMLCKPREMFVYLLEIAQSYS